MNALSYAPSRQAGGRLPSFEILGISGSGRMGSYNTALLKAAQEMLPDRVALHTCDISRFPLYNEDMEYDSPEVVREFKARVRAADAILFATPEYNYSIPAALKNALEWGNRPEGDNSWDSKPAAIVSASTGPRGGARAQLVLRQIMVDLNIYPINEPQFLLANAQSKFDGKLGLADENSRERLRNLLLALVQWTARFKGSNLAERLEQQTRSA